MMDADKYCSGCAKDAAECECGEPPSPASDGYGRKPCPFCGGENLILVSNRNIDDLYFVNCIDCCTEGPLSKNDRAGAETLWNTRP